MMSWKEILYSYIFNFKLKRVKRDAWLT